VSLSCCQSLVWLSPLGYLVRSLVFVVGVMSCVAGPLAVVGSLVVRVALSYGRVWCARSLRELGSKGLLCGVCRGVGSELLGLGVARAAVSVRSSTLGTMPPMMDMRYPYVGTGADGALRSARIDESEAETLDLSLIHI